MTEEEQFTAQQALEQAGEGYRDAHKLRSAFSGLVAVLTQRGAENHLAEGFAAIIERKLTEGKGA